MTKVPLHPDEIRIGFVPQAAGKSNKKTLFVIIGIAILAIAVYLYYKSKQKDENKQQ